MLESEIDKAIPYLDKLNNEIEILKQHTSNKNKQKSLISFFFCKIKDETSFKEPIIYKKRKRTLNSKTYWKDGYEFLIRLQCIYDDKNHHNCYYEFFVNIKYGFEIRKNEFSKKFCNIEKAKKYYQDMEGVFKHLRRRELMEKLFDQKKHEIEKIRGFL